MDHQRTTSKSINIDNKLTKPFRSLVNPGMKCLTVQRQKRYKIHHQTREQSLASLSAKFADYFEKKKKNV